MSYIVIMVKYIRDYADAMWLLHSFQTRFPKLLFYPLLGILALRNY